MPRFLPVSRGLLGGSWRLGTSLFLALSLTIRASPEKWKAAVAAFAVADATHPSVPGVIVFTGSSSIAKWKTLSEDFPGVPVLNRGFGGSELSDCVYYFDQLILPSHPRLVVVYAGDNDLAAGKSPQVVTDEFAAFCSKLHAALPETKVIFMSIKPSPLRWKLRQDYVSTNALIATYCAKDSRRAFVDIYASMLGKDGEPMAELFLADNLHMTLAGYKIWTKALRPFLSTAITPEAQSEIAKIGSAR